MNIDGSQLVRLRRRNHSWIVDPRIPANSQLPNSYYTKARQSGFSIDHGHLVRRLDPVWGTEQECEEADKDTFHLTNSSPQHSNLNQRTWLELEDYILNKAEDIGFKVTAFTGPVFNNDDKSYRGVQVPAEYWKVVVVMYQGRLSVTGYLQSQKDLIEPYVEAVYAGKFFCNLAQANKTLIS